MLVYFQEDSTTLEPVKAKKVKVEETPEVKSTPEGKKSKKNKKAKAQITNSVEGGNSKQATPVSKLTKNGSPSQAKNRKKCKKKKTTAE